MQVSGKCDNAAAALMIDDRESRLFKRLVRMNKVRTVLLLTAITILGSEAMTATLMLSFSAPKSWVMIGLAISTVCPLTVAPPVIIFLLRTVYRLERSRELIAELAMTDTLTGSYNRRYFMLQAQSEFDKAQRHNLPLSIIMLDADRFKSLNDTYGHNVGDEVLQKLSAACRKNLRASDVFARYGGEEFIVLLPLTDGPAAHNLAERIRCEVAEMCIYCGEVLLPVTISLGVAERLPSIASINEMLKEADLCLYEAKKNGRNCVARGKVKSDHA